MAWALAALVVSVLVALVGAGFGYSMWRRRWLIADTPTSDAAHVFVGANEVRGRAMPVDRPIVAPYSGAECVWYRSLLEKEDRGDENRSRWRTVSDESSEAPFWIEDDTGRVLVRPRGASVYTAERTRATHPARPARASSIGVLRAMTDITPLPPLGDSSRHRSTEWILRPGEDIYLLGDATLRDDAIALEFSPCDRGIGAPVRPLLVSAGDEARAARRTSWQAIALLVLVLLGVAGTVVAWHAVRAAQEGPEVLEAPDWWDAARGQALLAASVVVAALPVAYVVRLHNRLVATRNRALAAWSLIGVHLRRRHDLLPQLARVVAGAAAHERETQQRLTALRAGAPLPEGAELPDDAGLRRAEELDQLDRAQAHQLLAVAESHPELLTDLNFRRLAEQITAEEDGVAFARTFYNDAVTVMRDRRRQLPGALFASLVPVPSLELWEADQAEARPGAAGPAPHDVVDRSS